MGRKPREAPGREHEQAGEGWPPCEPPPDEFFYAGGHWYKCTPPADWPLPPFEHGSYQPEPRWLRDWRWSQALVNPPGPLCIITGI